MEPSVFRVRVGPLLPPNSIRALRCVSRAWQDTVDQLVAVKGALGLRPWRKWTPADVRFAHANVRTVGQETALAACAGGELRDLQWGLATFMPQDTGGSCVR
jgi:polyisoprenoid-binding protein YceI